MGSFLGPKISLIDRSFLRILRVITLSLLGVKPGAQAPGSCQPRKKARASGRNHGNGGYRRLSRTAEFRLLVNLGLARPGTLPLRLLCRLRHSLAS